MTQLPIFQSLILHYDKGKHTKQEGDSKVCCRRPQSQKAAQVAEQDKQEYRSDIIGKFLCIWSQYSLCHLLQHFHTKFNHILKCTWYICGIFHGFFRHERQNQDNDGNYYHPYRRCSNPDLLTADTVF